MTPDETAALERFRTLLRIPTVSRAGEPADIGALDAFRAAIEGAYPRVRRLERELLGGQAVLIRWPGRSATSPTVLMAHQDVVPAPEEGWTHPPFAAEVDEEGVLWGRGTFDDKGSLAGILEAVESALAAGITPAHDVWLAFGHDEEVGGTGAVAIVDALEDRGVRPGLVIDEGGAIASGVLPGVRAPLAVIGVAEKGIATIELVVTEPGGHASTPPRTTAADRLARAILRLRRHPDRRGVPEPTIAMLEHIGAHATGAAGRAMRSARRLRPLLPALLGALGPETAAMSRTTRAVTRLSGSEAPNVLPERVSATIDARIAVGSSVDAAVRHMRRVIRDPRVELRVLWRSDPTPVSPWSGEAWGTIAAVVGETRPDAVVAPYVMRGASDARHFHRIASEVYRFVPFEISTDELAAIHAIDERIRVPVWLAGVRWYERLLLRL